MCMLKFDFFFFFLKHLKRPKHYGWNGNGLWPITIFRFRACPGRFGGADLDETFFIGFWLYGFDTAQRLYARLLAPCSLPGAFAV